MHKIVRKLRTANYWQIGEHESWFADMAAKGLHLKKMGFYFTHFVKGDPKNIRYRIEVSKHKEIEEEQLQVYTESGWDYVTSYQVFHVGYHVFHVFSSPEERNAPELHTDPAEQSYSLTELNARLWMNATISIVSVLVMVGMVLAIWFLDGTPTYILVDGFAIQQFFLSLFMGYLSYVSLQSAISIRALRNRLIEGKPINHHAPWKKQFRLNTTISLLFTFAVLFGTSQSFIQLMKNETKTLPETTVDLPIIRLADIEQQQGLIRSEQDVWDDVDWGNHYSYYWSLFAPIQYDAFENGTIPGEVWNDGSGDYSPSIHTKVYHLTFPSMSKSLISDLLKRNIIDDEEFKEASHPELDYLLVYENENMKEIYASTGSGVVYVNYGGHADTNVIIDNVVEKMRFIYE